MLAALRVALPLARACLDDERDPVRTATVRFASDGTVERVDIEGNDGSRDADACVKTALARARVEPFFDAHYTTRVVVRR